MRAAVAFSALVLLSTACGRTDRTVLPEQGEFFELLFATLPDAEVGASYDVPIAVLAVPAVSRLDWRLVSGTLPPGLSVQPDTGARGRLVGVPTQPGRFAFRLEVKDELGRSDRRGFELVVEEGVGRLVISPQSLPDAVLGSLYGARFEASGGTEPYVWSVGSGRLPPGLQLIGDGVFGGSPSASGDFTFEIRVVDARGAQGSRTYTLFVEAERRPLRIVTDSLPPGEVGETYEARIEAEGGTQPYQWFVSGLPDGLAFETDPSGNLHILGRPAFVGEFELQIEARDSFGESDLRSYVLEVDSDAPPLQILTNSLPSGRVGEVYSEAVRATGGAPPYRWSVRDGQVPAGLFLDNSGTPSTRLMGTPQRVQSAGFVIEVRDQAGEVASRPFVVDIEAEIPELRIVTTSLPDGLQGTIYGTTIEGEGGVPPYRWSVVSGALPPNLTLDPSGTPASQLTGQLIGQGSFTFEVELTDNRGAAVRRAFSLEIASAPTPPRIVTASLPNAGTCEAYSEPIQVMGGLPPMSWTVVAGTVPAGLALSPTGSPDAVLSGYPSAASSGTLTVRVQDALGQTDTVVLSLTVTDTGAPRWVALVGRLDSSRRDVYVSDICSGAPSVARRLATGTGGLFSNEVALSPDGRKLAFIGDYNRSSVQELFVVDLSGPTPGPATRIHSVGALGRDVRQFEFSPDSQWIAFVGDLVADGQLEVSVVDVSNAASPGPARVVSSPPTVGLNVTSLQDLSWSGDSRGLAYRAAMEQSGRTDVYWTTVDSTTGHVRLNPASGPSSDAFDLAWSPAGNGLAYTGDFDMDGRSDLYWQRTTPAPAGPPVRVSDLPVSGDVRSGRFGVSPDGNWLTFTANVLGQADELFAVSLRGAAPGVQTRLHTPFPTSRDVTAVLWSPTEARLVYVADQDRENVNELYMVDLRTANPRAPVRLNPSLPPTSDVRTGPTNLAWSSDGTWVGYLIADFNAQPSEIYVTDVTASMPTPRAIGPARTDQRLDARGLFFAPDSNHLAVVGDLLTVGVTDLFHVDLTSSAPAPVRLNPTTIPGADVRYTTDTVGVRRDGTGVFYIADQANDFVDEAWSVNILGGVVGPSNRMHQALPNGRRIERILVP